MAPGPQAISSQRGIHGKLTVYFIADLQLVLVVVRFRVLLKKRGGVLC